MVFDSWQEGEDDYNTCLSFWILCSSRATKGRQGRVPISKCFICSRQSSRERLMKEECIEGTSSIIGVGARL
uniref:Uncharacterized protein n=1 Tax=Arundo donax TaxID=35708 RepID=A0A0A9D8I4_ARUDO